MAELLPELLGRVRREGGHHQHQPVDRLTQHRERLRSLRCVLTGGSPRVGAPCAVPSLKAYSSLTSSISDDTAVFRCMRSSMSVVTRRIVSCVLRRRAFSASVQSGAAFGYPFPANRLGPVIDEPPHAHQEPEAALEPGIAPLDFLLRRRDEHHIQPQRVGAVLLQHVVRIDDVAFGLRHDGAVLEHHALRQQRLNGSSKLTSPTSRSTRVKKREYSRWRMACSTPPL